MVSIPAPRRDAQFGAVATDGRHGDGTAAAVDLMTAASAPAGDNLPGQGGTPLRVEPVRRAAEAASHAVVEAR
jgi:hypothetical protein